MSDHQATETRSQRADWYEADEPEDFPWDVCPTCKGRGTVNRLTTTTCPTCKGSGEFL